MPANTDTVARGCRETREPRPSAVASQDADAAITTNMDRGQLQTCATFSLVSGKTLQLAAPQVSVAFAVGIPRSAVGAPVYHPRQNKEYGDRVALSV